MEQVKPEEVKAFLDEQTKSENENNNVFDLEAAIKEQEAEDIRIKELHEQVEEERVKTFDPELSTLANVSPWKIDDDNFKVEINNEDKALYLKSLLHDEPVRLNIKLEMGINFEIKSLTNYDLEIVHLTLMDYVDSKRVIGPAQYASTVQQCAVAIQICKIQDKNIDPPVFTPEKITIEEAVKVLKERVEKIVGKWSWPKWQAAVTAVRLFEYKLTLCNANARDSNFWQTADAN